MRQSVAQAAHGARRRGRPRGLRAALLLLPFLVAASLKAEVAAIEDGGRFAVRSAYFEPHEGVLELYALLELALSRNATQALMNGVPITLEADLSVDRPRHLIPDESIAHIVLRWRLQYHALSERYLVTNLNSGQQTTFATLEAAFLALRELRAVPVLDESLLERGLTYEASMRLIAEVEGGLPDAVRWVMFWIDWKRTSDRYIWNLRL